MAMTDAVTLHRRFADKRLRAKGFVFGAAVILFWIGCALFGAHLVPYDPYADALHDTLQSPNATHWFGTDQLGRDILSRVIVGARDILTLAPLATLLGTLTGAALGLVTGYFRGFIDDVLSRIIAAVLALPPVLMALLALVALGPSNLSVILVVGFTLTPNIARTVRSAVLTERERDYVAAARLRNESAGHILLIEILPNILPPIVVEATVRLGYAIVTVATLSFIGFGIQPPSTDWGLGMSGNDGLISGGCWWTVLFDALAIVSLVVAVNLVAEGIRGALDA